MPVQTRQRSLRQLQDTLHDACASQECAILAVLPQAIQPSEQTAPPASPTPAGSLRHTATHSDEQIIAELQQYDQQCLDADIASCSNSTSFEPDFQDEAEYTEFQQGATTQRRLDAARREAEALFESEMEQQDALQAAVQSARAEQEACCQQLRLAAELIMDNDRFDNMNVEELSALQAAAQHFLTTCHEVRETLHKQQLTKMREETARYSEAFRLQRLQQARMYEELM